MEREGEDGGNKGAATHAIKAPRSRRDFSEICDRFSPASASLCCRVVVSGLRQTDRQRESVWCCFKVTLEKRKKKKGETLKLGVPFHQMVPCDRFSDR